MPYIKRDTRLKFDEGIADILGALQTHDEIKMGELNYVISSIVWNLFEENKSYSFGNDLVGCLECVKHEFYRRQLAKYEDEKCEQNGDIV